MSMYFTGSPFSKCDPIACATSSPFHASVTFFQRGRSAISRRASSDEIVLELDERPVPQVVRREVVGRDVVGDEAAAERAGALVAVGGEPLAVSLQLVAGEDRWERARDPTRLERVRRVRARADLTQAEVPAGVDDRASHVLPLPPRAKDEPYARHPMVQSAYLPPADRELAHVEELDLRQRAAVRLLQHLHRRRPLDRKR